jgi:hypothetical protein
MAAYDNIYTDLPLRNGFGAAYVSGGVGQVNEYNGFEAGASFQRGSAATFIKNGVVVDAPLLTNEILRSEEFSNTYWSKSGFSVFSSTTETAPDDSATGHTYAPSGAGEGVLFLFLTPVTTTIGEDYKISLFVKEGTATTFSIVLAPTTGGEDGSAVFSWEGGIPTLNASAGDSRNISILKSSNGWYKVSFDTKPSTTASSMYIVIGANQAGLDLSIWGAQVEELQGWEGETLYKKTTGTTTDSGEPRFTGSELVLEGTSTNETQYSDDMADVSASGYWVASSGGSFVGKTSSPDGKTTAAQCRGTASNSSINHNGLLTGIGVGQASMSVFIKNVDATASILRMRDGGFGDSVKIDVTWNGATPSFNLAVGTDLIIEELLDDWYRVSATGTLAFAGSFCAFLPETSGGTGDILLWGAQEEAKEVATSYIRTAGAAVIRAADHLELDATLMPTAPGDYSVGASAKSLMHERTIDQEIVRFTQAALNHRLYFANTTDNPAYTVEDVTVTGAATLVNDVLYRLLGVHDASANNTLYRDGEADGTPQAAAARAATTNIFIGDNGTVGFNALFGCVKDLRIYDSALSPADAAQEGDIPTNNVVDARRTALTRRGYTGTVEDQLRQFWEDAAGRAGLSVDDLKKIAVRMKGFNTFEEYLTDMGYTGSFDDKEYRFWIEGGYFQ